MSDIDYAETQKQFQEERVSYLKDVGGAWFAKRNTLKYWKSVFIAGGKGDKPVSPQDSGIPYLILQEYAPPVHKQQKWFQQGFNLRPEEERLAIKRQQETAQLVAEQNRIRNLEDPIDRVTSNLVPPEVHRTLTREQKVRLYEQASEEIPRIIQPL